jgi:hypothetical protein
MNTAAAKTQEPAIPRRHFSLFLGGRWPLVMLLPVAGTMG